MSETDNPGGDDVFDVERIRQLVELMEDHDLREVDLRRSDQRIRLCRGVEPQTVAAPVPAAAPAPPPVAAAPAAAPVVEAPKDEANITYIKSPMVGTFYIRPNPKAEAYVRIGDIVDPDTTVCIIEAMKVFNEIPAEISGRIVAILVDDEEPVEFGKPLFKVDTKPSG